MIVSTKRARPAGSGCCAGISQISGGSRTSVGGYYEPEPEDENSSQFDVSDNRTLDEVVNWLMQMGRAPSVPPATGKAVPATGSCLCANPARSRTVACPMP